MDEIKCAGCNKVLGYGLAICPLWCSKECKKIFETKMGTWLDELVETQKNVHDMQIHPEEAS